MHTLTEITDLLYPRRCPVCDGILGREEQLICGSCRGTVKLLTGAVCCCCGKPLEDEQEEYCFDCRKKKHVFLTCRAPFLYSGKIKASLMRFKYLGRAEYARFFGTVMTMYGRKIGYFGNLDLIIPVPLHRGRRIERGYNQAELLAWQISLLTGIPLQADCIRRAKKTAAQKSVSGGYRGRNLKAAFRVPEKKKAMLAGKRILLIDDIYTTGSTADAVSSQLLLAGAASVRVLCVSVSPGFA